MLKDGIDLTDTWKKVFSGIRNAQLFCSGIGLEYPKLRIDDGMLAMRVNMTRELFPNLDLNLFEKWQKTGNMSDEYLFWKEHMNKYKISKY